MDYIARFGLEFNPFLKNSREIIIENDEYQEIMFRLGYLVETKGFGLLTGSPGLGKTTAIRNFAASLNPAKYKVIYSSLSTLTVMEFYRSLVASFGAEPAFRKADNFRIIQENITRLALEKRITPVIILDEANHISNAILSDLKLLFNFEMDSRDRAVILLAGLPQLNNTMRLTLGTANPTPHIFHRILQILNEVFKLILSILSANNIVKMKIRSGCAIENTA